MSADTPALQSYRAVVEKVDGAVAAIAARRRDAIACAEGCSACCTAGLSVLPVEAAAIVAHATGPDAAPRVAEAGPKDPAACPFLDEAGACTIYPARPLLCRTHGLPVRTSDVISLGSSKRLTSAGGSLMVCSLNFVDAPPAPADVLDGATLQALLSTTDALYRAQTGAPDGRVPLATLAAALRDDVTAL